MIWGDHHFRKLPYDLLYNIILYQFKAIFTSHPDQASSYPHSSHSTPTKVLRCCTLHCQSLINQPWLMHGRGVLVDPCGPPNGPTATKRLMPLASSVSTSRWFRSSMTQRSVTKHTRRWPCEADGKVISSILRHGAMAGCGEVGLLMSPGWKARFLPQGLGLYQNYQTKQGRIIIIIIIIRKDWMLSSLESFINSLHPKTFETPVKHQKLELNIRNETLVE